MPVVTTKDETYDIMGTAEKVVPFLIPQVENKINKKLSCCTTNCPVRKYERTERKYGKKEDCAAIPGMEEIEWKEYTNAVAG